MIDGYDLQHVKGFAPELGEVLAPLVSDGLALVRMEDRWDTFGSSPPHRKWTFDFSCARADLPAAFEESVKLPLEAGFRQAGHDEEWSRVMFEREKLFLRVWPASAVTALGMVNAVRFDFSESEVPGVPEPSLQFTPQMKAAREALGVGKKLTQQLVEMTLAEDGRQVLELRELVQAPAPASATAGKSAQRTAEYDIEQEVSVQGAKLELTLTHTLRGQG